MAFASGIAAAGPGKFVPAMEFMVSIASAVVGQFKDLLSVTPGLGAYV